MGNRIVRRNIYILFCVHPYSSTENICQYYGSLGITKKNISCMRAFSAVSSCNTQTESANSKSESISLVVTSLSNEVTPYK